MKRVVPAYSVPTIAAMLCCRSRNGIQIALVDVEAKGLYEPYFCRPRRLLNAVSGPAPQLKGKEGLGELCESPRSPISWPSTYLYPGDWGQEEELPGAS